MLKLICEKLFYALPSFQPVITSLACGLHVDGIFQITQAIIREATSCSSMVI